MNRPAGAGLAGGGGVPVYRRDPLGYRKWGGFEDNTPCLSRGLSKGGGTGAQFTSTVAAAQSRMPMESRRKARNDGGTRTRCLPLSRQRGGIYPDSPLAERSGMMAGGGVAGKAEPAGRGVRRRSVGPIPVPEGSRPVLRNAAQRRAAKAGRFPEICTPSGRRSRSAFSRRLAPSSCLLKSPGCLAAWPGEHCCWPCARRTEPPSTG